MDEEKEDSIDDFGGNLTEVDAGTTGWVDEERMEVDGLGGSMITTS